MFVDADDAIVAPTVGLTNLLIAKSYAIFASVGLLSDCMVACLCILDEEIPKLLPTSCVSLASESSCAGVYRLPVLASAMAILFLFS